MLITLYILHVLSGFYLMYKDVVGFHYLLHKSFRLACPVVQSVTFVDYIFIVILSSLMGIFAGIFCWILTIYWYKDPKTTVSQMWNAKVGKNYNR